MKTDHYQRIIGELHARIDPLLEDLAREAAGRLGEEATFMSISEYAKHARVSTKTVGRWVRGGLPVARDARGKVRAPIRIKVAEADNWDAEEATRRAAELSAHGAES